MASEILPTHSDEVIFDTRQLLANAAEEARARGYDDWLIIDADCHHYETESMAEIIEYIEDPVVKHFARASSRKGAGRPSLLPSQLGNQDMSGRVSRYQLRALEKGVPGVPKDVTVTERAMDQIGTRYAVLFPTPMFFLGTHPQVEVEVAVARAYARWMTERVLPHTSRIKTMLYLPFNDPDACLRMIEDFGDRHGVVGFMVTCVRFSPIHHNQYMKVYRAIEERGVPLAFHSTFDWQNRPMFQLNRFISVHALGFPLFNMIHILNFVTNGIPERFPDLRVIWIEGGLAYITFLMQRLDNEYMMRSSEAPLLRGLPSDYMRRFYYTSQPMERVKNRDWLEVAFRMINAETQLLYASDYPHWDFDLPSTVYDLPFLTEHAKRRILGENARELFRLDPLPAQAGQAASR